MYEDIWKKLYCEARKVQKERVISPFIEAGGVAAALLTKKGSIYVGVCIDTASTLGMCAERNAIANMITNGEHQIDKMVAVVEDGSVGAPCGACREYMMQLDKDSGDIEILVDFEKRRVTVNGREVHLTRVEYKIVSLLAKNSGKVITYDTIINEVWGPYADDNNRILRVNMANIRRKIEATPGEPKYIFTELGVVYRMLEDENLS